MAEADRDQRVHEPTPRRRQEFRRRGDVARSKDLVVWATVAGGAIGCIGWASTSGRALVDLMARTFADLGAEPTAALCTDAVCVLIVAAAPTAIGAGVGWLVAALVQLGWPPAIKPLSFDLVRIATLQGALPMLSPKAAAIRVLMSTAKVAVVAAAAWIAVSSEHAALTSAPLHGAVALAERLGPATRQLLSWGAGALAVLAAVDVWHQRRSMAARMRMSPQELQREHKDAEGDPLLKRKRRERARQNARRQRPEIAVRTADVVIVNPTHYAVALRYDARKESAPRVLAKGKDAIAAKLREAARRHGVPIVEEPPLARLLHRLVEEGQPIPENLFHAVAEVLAYVYRLRDRRAGR